MKNLVIVESPAKARTISKFLGSDYTVMASIKQIKKDTVIYLAADEDREGEAIAWHLIPALKIEKNPLKRIVFHEITEKAILTALESPRDVDQNLVDAQQARRILDRAVGYKLSPLIWKKVRYGLSAGRVQSVAVRILVDREKEIEAFIPVEFWKVKTEFNTPELKADLAKIDNKLAKVNNETEAKVIENSCKQGQYILEDIEEKESKRNPAPPFTTSTLQQEASRKAGFGVKQTMIVAQQLYEGGVTIPGHTGGLITYMRTDSVNLSTFATSAAKEVIIAEYGNEYALSKPRHYKSKAKGAQEAHEAIRPVNLALKPSDVQPYLDHSQYRLYSLIWKRTIATQMAQAVVANTTYKISAGANKEYEFQSKGTRIVFPGFMKSYTEGSDDPESALDNTEKILPTIAKGTILNLEKLITEQNFTKPPARYTEASLVKKMEAEGIGRPSTYAPTIATIQAREYVIKTEDKKLKPTLIGTVVNDFLIEHFDDIVSLGFTAHVEEEFDKIADGKLAWQDVMKEFYEPFVKNVDDKTENAPRAKFSDIRELGEHPEMLKPITARVGQYGPYVQCGTKEDEEKPKIASIPNTLSVNNITLEESLVLLQLPKVLGQDENGNDIKVNIGRFGPYLQIKSEYFSLKEDDPYTVELPRALEVIKELKEIKAKALLKDFPDEETQIIIGRYGPYIKSKKKNYKLPKELDEQDIKALNWDEVKEIIKNQPVKGRRGAAAKKEPAKKATTKKTTAKKATTKKTPAKKATTPKKATAVKKTTAKKAE